MSGKGRRRHLSSDSFGSFSDLSSGHSFGSNSAQQDSVSAAMSSQGAGGGGSFLDAASALGEEEGLSKTPMEDLLTMVQDDPRLREQLDWHGQGNLKKNAKKARDGSGGSRLGMLATKIPGVNAIKQGMHMRDEGQRERVMRNMRDRQGARGGQGDNLSAVMAHGFKQNHQKKRRKDAAGLAVKPAAAAIGAFTGGLGADFAGEFMAESGEMIAEGVESGAKSVGETVTSTVGETAGEKSTKGGGKMGGGNYVLEDYSPNMSGGGGYQKVKQNRMDDAGTLRAMAHYLGPAQQEEDALEDFAASAMNEDARLEMKRRLGSPADEDMAARPKQERRGMFDRSHHRLTKSEQAQYQELSGPGKKKGWGTVGSEGIDDVNALAMIWEAEKLWSKDKQQTNEKSRANAKSQHSRYQRLEEDD